MNMGNFFGSSSLFNNLENRQVSDDLTGYESSSSEYEHPSPGNVAKYESSLSENEGEFLDNTTDSNIHYGNNISSKLATRKSISLETVRKMESDLEYEELISLVFLLYDRHLALNAIFTMIGEGPAAVSKDKLSRWAMSNPENWSSMLIEALAVVQNYSVLERLGFSRQEVDTRFLPRIDSSVYLDRTKKMLYSICEKLTKEQIESLVEQVDRDNFDGEILVNCDILEFHILSWIDKEYIHIDKEEVDLKNLIQKLKYMDLLDLVNEIEIKVKSINEHRRMLHPSKKNIITRHPIKDKCKRNNTRAYPIKDERNVGLLVCVNIDEFHRRETRDEFKHLLPKEELVFRQGSDQDELSLYITFKMLHFKIIKIHNPDHDNLMAEVCKAVSEQFDRNIHSMFFLCILSHGENGKIYAANSIPVRISDIKDMVTDPRYLGGVLAGVPKVMIVQACQGNKPLCVESVMVDDLTGETLQVDGPITPYRRYSDLLVCMSIVPGHYAVRSPIKGSRYIQVLCKCVNKYYRQEHFQDIVTRVHDILNNEKMHLRNMPRHQSNCREEGHDDCVCVYMTPEKIDTLCKNLYLANI